MTRGMVRLFAAVSLCLGAVGCVPLSGGATTAKWVVPSAGPDDLLTVLHMAILEDRHFYAVGVVGGFTVSGGIGDVDADPWRPCRAELSTDRDRMAAMGRDVTSKITQITHRAFGYREVEAADVVADIRRAAGDCDSYRITEGDGPAEYTVRAPVPLPDIPGVDRAYAYCESGHNGEYIWSFCYAALARGNVLSMIRVNRAEEEPARDLLVQLVPPAAELLVEATGPD